MMQAAAIMPAPLPAAGPPAAVVADLARYLDEFTAGGAAPFSWPNRNCAHLAGGWWQRATGTNPLAGLEMPDSGAAALRWLGRRHLTLADAVTQYTGRAPLASPHLAQMGDVVALAGAAGLTAGPGAGLALGICTGRLVALITLGGAIGYAPLHGALWAWPLQAGRA
jgi:hypothetical protein